MDSRRRSSVSQASVEKTEASRNNVGNGTIPIILKNTDSADRISQLPDDVIYHIFSFLTPRDIVATRTLGKTWSRISPELKLNPKHFIKNRAVKLFESYKSQGVRVKTCSLNIPDPYKYSTSINDWLQLVAENDIYVLCIRFGFTPRRHFSFSFPTALSNGLVVLSLQNCSIRGLTFSSKLHSLQELTLNNVKLSDFCDIFISSFYNIKKLRLKHFWNLYCLSFNRLIRLEKVEIWSRYSMESREKPWLHRHCGWIDLLSFQGCNNLETLWLQLHDSNLSDAPNMKLLPGLDIFTQLPRLKKLFLHGEFQLVNKFRIELPTLEVLYLCMENAIINNPWLGTFKHNVIQPKLYISTQLPRLKKLFLNGRFQMEKKFRIEYPALEVLYLSYVDGIEDIIINTPSLRTFKFAGKAFEPFLFTMNTGTQLRKISLEFHESCPIDAIWFLKLHSFAKNLSQFEVLSLRITNVVHLICESLEKFRLPVRKLKRLKVTDLRNLSPLSCKDLINGILWGFRPETLTLILGLLAKDLRECIEVIQKHLQNMKGSNRECCSSAPFRCRRQGFKHAEIELSSRVSKKMPYKDLVELNIKFLW